jgi:hypothetical protein
MQTAVEKLLGMNGGWGVRLYERPQIKLNIPVFWYKTPSRLVTSQSVATASNTEYNLKD